MKSRVFHRQPHRSIPLAVRGEGLYIVDSKGKRYLDASGGAAVSCLGHSDPDVIQAIKEQVDRLAYAHTGFFTTEAMEELADVLVADAPAGLGRVEFVSGGSEGMETAFKLARQYVLEVGEPRRSRFIARRQSYHGTTLGALAVGGNPSRRRLFEPLLFDTCHIAPCYAYRGRRPNEGLEAYGHRVADELEAKIEELGPETVAAFVAEPVVGATLGAVPAVPGYFRRIRDICDRYGVLLILDEVMCGTGRTGTLFACEQEGVVPDILVMAKGLGAGYQPIGAVLVAEAIFEAIYRGSGFFHHGFTFMGHATACAAALAVERAIRERGLLERVRTLGATLEQALRARFGDHPHVGDIRGRGLLWGVEFVLDRETKEPFDPAVRLNARLWQTAMDVGLICYPMGGTVDGKAGDHVLVAPPFIATDGDIERMVDMLGAAVDAAVADARSS
ncbi:MAG: aspartate aminotransferase family protein [Alphaproteobacteria bacterium]